MFFPVRVQYASFEENLLNICFSVKPKQSLHPKIRLINKVKEDDMPLDRSDMHWSFRSVQWL